MVSYLSLNWRRSKFKCHCSCLYKQQSELLISYLSVQMRDMRKLAKRGWWKAMIHQGTLSLILTLDDFLISGPHLCTTPNGVKLSDSNVFVVKNHYSNVVDISEDDDEYHMEVSTYYVLRPHIRGILFGLNPLYQISLYVPCKDQTKISLYKEMISKIDIGGQFFQDRIYWNYEALRTDIMDSRLACLIHSGNFPITDDWLKKISVEFRAFNATLDDDLTMSNNLFELVEIRSFLEDVHQRFFSLVNESKKFCFSHTIRLYLEEKAKKGNHNDCVSNTSGFSSATNSPKYIKRFMSEGHSTGKAAERKLKIDFMFKTATEAPLTWKIANVDVLLEEYEDIIQEQLEINHDINKVCPFKSSFAKTLCRWNKITQRKSDVLKLLMSQGHKEYINERLRQLNSVYCMKKFQSETELFVPEQSAKSTTSTSSGGSYDIVIPNKMEHNGPIATIPQFTIWYVT